MKKRTSSSAAGKLRRRAETSLRHQSPRDTLIDSHSDTKRLLHELQVHQIELELQNEELQQAKIETEVHLDKYTDLYDFAPVGYFSLDENGIILEANLKAASLLGVERSHLAKSRFQIFIAPQSRADFPSFLEGIFSGHKTRVCEALLMRCDRPAFWVDMQAISASTQTDAPKWCRLAIMDVSVRKIAEEIQIRADRLTAENRHLALEITRREAAKAKLKASEQRALQSLKEAREFQEQLRLMSHQMLMVEEKQRKEISRDLHDKICQLLVGINVHLAIFAKTAARNPQHIGRSVGPLRRLVAEGVKTVHRFARDLRPSALDDLGLIPAIRSYIEDFPKRKGRRIDFAAFAGAELLDADKRTVLYRVTQESLVNAAKHSCASVITVRILQAEGGIVLEVADNGVGFAQSRHPSAKRRRRLGMLGMRERVEMVGGRFTAESTAGKGVTVQAAIPFGSGNHRATKSA